MGDRSREDRASEAPAVDVGDGGQVEPGLVSGRRRPGGTNRMRLFFCVLFSFICLADMGGRSMGCLTLTAQARSGQERLQTKTNKNVQRWANVFTV